MVGRRSLWRQQRLSTSSAKPRNIIQQMERRAHRNWANWRGEEGGEWRSEGRRGERVRELYSEWVWGWARVRGGRDKKRRGEREIYSQIGE